MSWRTLVEINHDYLAEMERDPAAFVAALSDRLRTPDAARAPLPRGVRTFGTRHHGDAFQINWGGVESKEGYTP